MIPAVGIFRPGMRAYFIPFVAGIVLAISAFLPWVIVGEQSLTGIPDVWAIWIAGLGALAAVLAMLSLITRKNSRHPLLVIGRVHSVPTLMWKLAGEITPADVLVRREPASDNQSDWPAALPLLADLTAEYADTARHLPDDGGDPGQFSLVQVESVVEAGRQSVYSLRVESTMA